MIRIGKSADKPRELDKGYNAEEVCKRLLAEQHEKCYLCERRLSTDYQVEHLKSQVNHPDLVHEWGNLYVACSYCNAKKSSKFDDILNPSVHDIEIIIRQTNDFVRQKVVFSSGDTSSEVRSTVQLLDLLFNGKLLCRNCREQRFYDEFIRKMNFFSFAVDRYIAGEKEKYYPVIEEQLAISGEYLGFKYAIVHSNDLLKEDFGNKTNWNKKRE